MIYNEINGQKISRITLGTADFGTNIDKKTSFELMDMFLDYGGNSIDTGRAYSYWIEGGANTSESTIGSFISERKNRDKIFLSTKGGHPPIPHFEISRINEKELTKDLNESLFYLKTDYLDVFYLHRDDENKPVSEIMPILDKFVKEGKTRYIGASNWKATRILEANKFAIENGLTPFAFTQVMWSYAKVNWEAWPDKSQVAMNDREYTMYRNIKDIQVTAYSSQAQGFYSILKEKSVDNLPNMYKDRYLNDVNLKRFEEINEISNKTGLSPTSVGLAKLLQDEIKPIALIGAINKDYLEDSFNSLKII